MRIDEIGMSVATSFITSRGSSLAVNVIRVLSQCSSLTAIWMQLAYPLHLSFLLKSHGASLPKRFTLFTLPNIF